jgi:hypothetical protein
VNTAHKGFVLGWALGIAGLLAGSVGAGGVIAGMLAIAGGTLLAGAGLLTVTGEGPVYRGARLTPALGGIMIAIGLIWDVFGAAVAFGGW